MASTSLKQASFSGGLISPQALGRSDQQKYAIGLREISNAWITRYGTIENRAGTQFIGEVKTSSKRVRLIPFVVSQTASYLIEAGDAYMRIYQNGVRISVAGAAAWVIGTTYGVGDLVTYLGVVYWSSANANTGNQPNISPGQWYAQAGALLEILTSLPQAALPDLQYVQQNDVMNITEQLVPPQTLERFSTTKWTIGQFFQTTGIASPTGVSLIGTGPSISLAPPSGGSATGGIHTVGQLDAYEITAFNHSVQSTTIGPFTAGVDFTATLANPITLTWTASVGAAVGYAIYKDRHGGTGEYGLIGLTDAATLTFVDTDAQPVAEPVAIAPDTAPGTNTSTYIVTAISLASGIQSLGSTPVSGQFRGPDSTHPITISWTTVAGAASYNVYKLLNGVPGFIGNTGSSSFRDDGILPDTSIQPPIAIPLFNTSDDYPAVCGYYQQRLCFANTINQPQTVWMSRVGLFSAFTTSTPVVDNDAIQFTIAGRQVQQIRALVDLGKLIVHTSNAEYICTGNQAGTMTPGSIGLVANGSAGAALAMPVILGNTDLFIQQSATRILDLRYEVQSFSYAGKDLTKFATDLFAGRTIVDMAWQKLPHSIVWCVLDNGVLLGLTYVREDELWAWHEHVSTNGAFENVCVIPEGTKDVAYVVVRRTINGVTKRYIERLADRACLDTVTYSDSVFADSSLTFDGRNTGSHTMTATMLSGWTPTDTVTLTASASTFVLGDVGNAVVFQVIDPMTGLVSDQITFGIVGYTSATVVTAVPQRTVPTWAQATPLTAWGKAVKHFAGIGHLEGQSLSILADGNVVADPLDSGYPLVTVTAGAFTLTTPAMVVTAGLPIQMDLQTLPVENAAGETIANRRIIVRRCTPIFHNSRGGKFGQDFAHLNAWKQVPTEAPAFGFPVPSITGPSSVPINGTPQVTGQVCIRQTNPVPFGISALVVTGEIMDAT